MGKITDLTVFVGTSSVKGIELNVLSAGIDGSEFSRKKKHPDVAYRSHELFDMTAPRGAMEGGQEGVRVPRVSTQHPVSKLPEILIRNNAAF